MPTKKPRRASAAYRRGWRHATGTAAALMRASATLLWNPGERAPFQVKSNAGMLRTAADAISVPAPRHESPPPRRKPRTRKENR